VFLEVGKTFKQKPKAQKGKTRCAKCRGTGHTTEEHRDNYVKPGTTGGQKRKNPTSAVPAKNNNKGKGKAKDNHVETHVAFMAVDSSTTLVESDRFMEIDDPSEIDGILASYEEPPYTEDEVLDWGEDYDEAPVAKQPRLGEPSSSNQSFRARSI
jgi:hypothetical protein